MSSVFKKLLKEVSGKAANEKGDRAPVVSTKPRKATANVVELFRTMAKRHFKISEQILKLKKEQSDVKDRVASVCNRHGVTVNTNDKAFYSHPYKAQVEYHRATGSINAEVIREWAKSSKTDLELFEKNDEVKLDVSRFQAMLKTDAVKDPKMRQDLEAAINAVMVIARANGFVEESDEEFLVIEKWDDAKAKGLVPKKISKKAEEHMQTSVRISIDKIIGDGKDRCPGCSDKVPKTRGMTLHTCKRCGTES